MSHYNPNACVSKTLIQHLIRFVAASGDVDEETARVLYDILATEISPELVPPGADGVIQSTESIVGPYALQDFNLFYATRFGFRPSKIAYLMERLGRRGTRPVAPQHSRCGKARVQSLRNQAMAPRLPVSLLRAQPVQALGLAQRPENLLGRVPVAARRLARPFGRHRQGLARRTRSRRPRQ
jgi:NH3-dependent NAD+ synthetase